MSCYRNQVKCAMSFGCGLLVSSLCPSAFVVVVAAVTVIIISLALLRG